MSKKNNIGNLPRKTIQWLVIAFMALLAIMPDLGNNKAPDFEAYCPFGGIQALGSYLLNQALSCSMTSMQIVMGLTLMFCVIVFSKLFCSYICPLGTIGEWLGKIGEGLNVRFTIKGIADKILRSLKYILLFITLFFTFKSNELFCKKFDPYYGVTSGFDSDVVILYSVIAIILLVFGSVFFRLFWCKYICPLGAISNIFKLTGFFVAIMVIYIVLLKFGVEVSYIWPLAIACAGGYFLELYALNRRVFPLMKITRNEDSCINCKICSKKCPQAINVATLKVVNHPDCNLCGECISACPVENTLQINKQSKFRYLPPVAVIALIVAGMFMGSFWEVPTIDQKWYDDEDMAKAEIFVQSGLKNIKCYGSSMAFASKMQQIDGILGVATYVKNNRVKIYYDPEIITAGEIQKQLFAPSKTTINPVPDNVSEIQEVTISLENFFDTYDFNYLSRLLAEKTKAVGLLSEYGCPVLVKIYFPVNETPDKESLIKIVESESLSFEYRDQVKTVELNFKVNKGPEFKTISSKEFFKDIFMPLEFTFNKFAYYDSTVVRSFSLPFTGNEGNKSKLNFLVSHLSNDNGVIGVQTSLDSISVEMLNILYVDSLTNESAIIKSLSSDSLKYIMSNKTEGKMENVFHFDFTDYNN